MSKWEDKEIVEIVEDQVSTEEDLALTEEETNLSGLGMLPERAQQFYKRFPFGKVFKAGQITPQFFSWWLEVVGDDELKAINGAELTNDLQMKLLEKQQEGALKIAETPLQQYIDKNSELMKQNNELTERIQEIERKADIFDELGHKYFLFTKFLYEFMSKKMEFKTKADVTDEDLNKIEEIKGGLNKK